MDLLALNVASFWAEWLRPILLLIVGLGAVIFVHELGHFLLAKLMRIKVERFALGFGPRLFGFKGRETDYRVNLLPLGGYVKMLGQEDFKPLKEGGGDPRAFYSKSVGARFAVISAGVIMNVVFAAVLSIVVCLAGIRFYAPVVGGVSEGYPAQEAVIRWHDGPKDSADAKVGLQPGDVILEIDGERVTRFQQLFVTAALADPGDTFRMKIRRRTDQGEWIGTTEVGVKPGESPSGAEILMFGIARPADTVLGEFDHIITDDEFRQGDRIVAVGHRNIRYHWDLREVQDRLEPRPVPVTVERGGQRVQIIVHPTLRTRDRTFFLKNGSRTRAERILHVDKGKGFRIRTKDGREVYLKKDADLAPGDDLLDILGCRPRVKVAGVEKGSPADVAGLRPGDILLDYGDRGVPSYTKLMDINRIEADTETSIVVERKGEDPGRMWIRPTVRHGRAVIGIHPRVDMSNLVVAGVREGSPAEKSGLRAGVRIVKVSAGPARSASQPATRPATGPATHASMRRASGAAPRPAAAATSGTATAAASRPAGGPQEPTTQRRVRTWADLLAALKELGGRDVTLTYVSSAHYVCECGRIYDPKAGDPTSGVKPGTAVEDLPDGWVCGKCGKKRTELRAHIGTLTEDLFDPDDYEVMLFESPRPFRPLMGPEVKKGPLAAIAWGAGETWLFLRQTYATLRSLISGTVSTTEVIGPVGLGGAAIQVGRKSVVELLYFLAMISVSLAVINFLPIPVVDGGHALFLLIEKIRGKPVPLRVMNVVQMIGLAFLLFVFVYVTWNDIAKLLRNLW